MMLTLEVVFGEAFASSRRFTICEWPCWAAWRYKIIICTNVFCIFYCIFATGLQIQNVDLYFVLSFVVDVFFYWSWSNWWRNLEVLKVRYNEGGRYWSFNSDHIRTPFPSSNIEILRVQLHYKCLSNIENDIEQRQYNIDPTVLEIYICNRSPDGEGCSRVRSERQRERHAQARSGP